MKKILSRIMVALLCCTVVIPAFAGCSGKKDAVLIMTDELSGLFNPFYATSGTDMDVVGMTQISMLATDKSGAAAAGEEYPTVVLDFNEGVYDEAKDETVYTFVLKNGLKFSDGKPLTMEDVMFNIYVYLDPVYTGSSTMYSTKIVGLNEYRQQQTQDVDMTGPAGDDAWARINELVKLYEDAARQGGSASTTYSISVEDMEQAIRGYDNMSSAYKRAVATSEKIAEVEAQGAEAAKTYFNNILLEDYRHALDTFKKELQADFKAAKESYDLTTMPYSEHKKLLENDIFKFFLYEGYILPEYAKKENSDRDNLEKIVKFNNTEIVAQYKSEEEAILRVYNDNISSALNEVLTGWGTYGTLLTEYTAAALSIALQNNVKGDELNFKNIEGIVSLGHTTDTQTVTVNGKTYNVAQEHNADGTPVGGNDNTSSSNFDVLQITIEERDPKAIFNFGFSVAPAHYYSADAEHPNGREIDIENDQFGVEWADHDFQSKTIQSQLHVEVPVGAGPFVATNKDNDDNPKGTEFWNSNVVYYKANEHFMFPVKAPKLRMQVVSASNAIKKLANNEIDYITPQFTKANSEELKRLERKGIVTLNSWQLGYGYIGINAGKVDNINIRRAIMAAMQTELATTFYKAGECKTIDWPMSMENWAYPFEDENRTQSKLNNWDYTQWDEDPRNPDEDFTETKEKIKKYMRAAGITNAVGDSRLKITFTIAGASITDHPTYAVFKQAAEILNELDWQVEVKADSQALTKLATGSLEVWAAAWGSTIDPDMYQVYHMDSTATSVYAWGYREIKSNQTKYWEEYDIISELSGIIDEARSYLEREKRIPLYEEAMDKVLELAVELPVYQRKTLFAYNSKTVKGFKPQSEVDSYNSPLSEIWNLELV